MNDRVRDAFDGIHAEAQLKRDTLTFLQGKMPQGQQTNHWTGFFRLATALACLLMLTFTGMVSYSIYFTEAMYVDVDMNPSIELTVNRFDRIIGVYAYNADGEELLAQLDLMHKPYDTVLTMLTESAIEKGFLSDGGLVWVTLQSDGRAGEEILLETLQTKISSAAQGHHTSVQVDVFSVDGDTREHAHEQNLSPAKYLAILELQTVDPTATVEGCRNHTIGEIRARTEAHSGGHHGQDDSDPAPAGGDGQRGNGHHRNRHD